MRLAHLDWTGPYSVEDVLEMTGDDDFGLYVISGRHVLFGLNSLLYIGRAVRVSFADRFQDHTEWLKEEMGIEIRVGRLRDGDYAENDRDVDWEQLVKDSEALSIYWHSPPYNSQCLNQYSGQALRIQNCGERGCLLPEVSSDWTPLRPDDADDE